VKEWADKWQDKGGIVEKVEENESGH